MNTRNATKPGRSGSRQVAYRYDRPLTLSEASAWLGVPDGRLAEWCKRYRIGHFRPSPGVYLFDETDLWEFLRDHKYERRTVEIRRAPQHSKSMAREER